MDRATEIRRELLRRELDKRRIEKSQAAQDVARNEGPSLADNAKAFGANALDALSSDSTPALIAQGIASPATLPVQGAIRIAREALDVDKKIADLGSNAPGAALAGTAAGALVGARGGKAPAGSVAKGVGAAASGGAAKAGTAARALTKLADDSPIARSAVALGTGGSSEAALAAAKLLGRIFREKPKAHPDVALPKRAKVDADAYAAKPEATASPVPQLDKSALRAILDDLKAPASTKADDIDYAKEADGFDPGGEAFSAWLKRQTPASAEAAVARGKAQVAGTRADRTPVAKTKTPVDPEAAEIEEIARVRLADVGADAPKAAPGGPSAVAEDAGAFLARMAAEDAARAERAGQAWKSLPLSPIGQPKPAALTTPQLRAEAKAAVDAGESLEALAARLGLNKTDRELVAVFKAAQLGF